MPSIETRSARRRPFTGLFLVAGCCLLYAGLRFLVPGMPEGDVAHQPADTEVIAHRGGSGLWPENTLYAFEKAAALGVDSLETDVTATADGILVLIHDDTVDRTTDGAGPVDGCTLENLKQLDAGYWWTADGGSSYPFRAQGITIPTLDEVLTALPAMDFTIEIKDTRPATAAALCETIRNRGAAGRVVVASVHGRVMQHFRSICPQVTTAAAFPEVMLLFGLDRVRLAHLYSVPAQTLAIPQSWPLSPLPLEMTVADGHFLATAHGRGIEVRVWTVNDGDDMRRYLDLNADGIITDYPDRLLAIAGRE